MLKILWTLPDTEKFFCWYRTVYKQVQTLSLTDIFLSICCLAEKFILINLSSGEKYFLLVIREKVQVLN